MQPARTICLGFLGVILIGALLLMLPFSTVQPGWDSPITALFTSTSAVCVTGLSVVDVGTFYTFWGQLWIAILAQVGGLGYMTATTFLLLLLGRKFGIRERLAVQQSLDHSALGEALSLVRSIIAATLIFEITGVFLLIAQFVPEFGPERGLWLAVFHSINAFNNAGFSLFPDNLIRYVDSPFVNLVVGGLIVFGGIGYPVLMENYLFLRDKLQGQASRASFSLNTRIATTTTALLLIGGTALFIGIESRNPDTLGSLSLPNKVLAAWFQAVTPRTAGFNTVDIGKLTMTGLFVTIALMFIGASPGSTGGGIKTTTFQVLVNCTQAALKGKEEVTSFRRRLPISLVFKAVGITLGSVGVILLSTTLLSIADPQISFISLLFEAVSAFATVGLSTGITSQLSVVGELTIIATMYIGRVGILTLINALQKHDPTPSRIHYPEESLLVG